MTLLSTRTVEPAERGAWLRLIRTRRVGPHSFWSLLDRFETAQAALDALPDLSRHGGARKPLQPFAAELAEQEYLGLRGIGGHLLVAVDAVFPPLLRQIDDPPPYYQCAGIQPYCPLHRSPWWARAMLLPTDNALPLDWRKT